MRLKLCAFLRDACFLACAFFVTPVTMAETGESRISYYESVDISMTGNGSESAVIAFQAFGKQFVAELYPNVGLIQKLPPGARRRVADIELWQGQLIGVPQSWVRVAIQEDFISGALWDGSDRYDIAPYAHVLPDLLDPDPADSGTTIIYRATELELPGTDIVVGEVRAAGPASADKDGAAGNGALKPSLATGLEAELGVVGDVEFSTRYGARAEAEALSLINIADAIFVQQLGVHLRVAALQIFETEPDPFDSTDAATVLGELENYKASTPAFASLDLAHLLTNKTFDANVDSRPVGIANIGAVCATAAGAAVSANGRVVAHEIAHNLGAPHDAQAGSPCASSPSGFIMDPALTVGDNSNTFSSCSISQMEQTVASAGCLSPIPTDDLLLSALSGPGNVTGNSAFDVHFLLSSVGAEDLFAIEFTLEATGLNVVDVDSFGSPISLDCNLGQSPILCTTHMIEAGKSVAAHVTVEAIRSGSVSIDGTAWALNDANTANNQDSFVIDVAAAVRLQGDVTSVVPELAIPGEIINVSASILNDGLTDASNVEVRLSALPDFVEFVSGSIPGGGVCELQPPGDVWSCPIGSIPVGQQSFIEMNFRALDTGASGNTIESANIRAAFVAAEPDVGPGEFSVPMSVNFAVADVALTIAVPRTVEQNRRARIDITIENHGPNFISEFVVHVSHAGISVDSWGGDICFVDAGGASTDCEIRRILAAGETYSLALSGPVSVAGSYTTNVAVEFSATDPDPVNNQASATWSAIAAQPASPPAVQGGGGGGGGAMAPVWMLFVLAVFRFTVPYGRGLASEDSPIRISGWGSRYRWRAVMIRKPCAWTCVPWSFSWPSSRQHRGGSCVTTTNA